jgi:hypothetical protein
MENQTPSIFSIDDDFVQKYIEQQEILNKKWKERAEKSHQIEIIFPREELEQIRQVNLWLKQILSELKNKQTENPQKYKNEDYEKRVLKLIMNDLDKLDLWMCKFSTSSMAIHKNEGISPKDSDSIYYMTRSGSSLRFKMSNYKEGIFHVIQFFSVVTRFRKTESNTPYPFDEYSLSGPIEGETMVEEKFYEDFDTVINQATPIKEDYNSYLVALADEHGFWDVASKNNKKPCSTHNGSLVNKIFFTQNKP